MALTIGIDLGGTKMSAGRVHPNGQIERKLVVPRPKNAHEMAIAPVELAEELWSDDVIAIGVGVAGLITTEGTLVWGPNVDGEQIPFGALMRERFAVPVVVDNDANFAALAEARIGVSQGHLHSIMITLGTGIGGGLILNGAIFRGASFAGEIGHFVVDAGGPACTCGQKGCWETFVSGRRLDQMARDIAARHPHGAVAKLAQGETPSGSTLTEAAVAGDSIAREHLVEMAEWLGLGIANLIAVLDPQIIVIGGGAAAAGELLLAPTRATVMEKLEGAAHRSEVPIVGAALGADAGLIGAALAANEMKE